MRDTATPPPPAQHEPPQDLVQGKRAYEWAKAHGYPSSIRTFERKFKAWKDDLVGADYFHPYGLSPTPDGFRLIT